MRRLPGPLPSRGHVDPDAHELSFRGVKMRTDPRARLDNSSVKPGSSSTEPKGVEDMQAPASRPLCVVLCLGGVRGPSVG